MRTLARTRQFIRATRVAAVVKGSCATLSVSEAGLHTDAARLIDMGGSFEYMDYNKSTNLICHHDFSVSALRDIAAGGEFLHDYGDGRS
jgi:hypothetical protein